MLDSNSVGDWLQRKVGDLVFSATISSQGEVICAHIPPRIRDILQLYEKSRERVVFCKIFGSYVDRVSKGAFDKVADVYDAAVSKYEEVCEKLDSGELVTLYSVAHS